jgi:hypothetical protein
MRIEYRILWVEDQKSWYETTYELFRDYLEDLGFILTSKRCENIDEVKTEIAINQLKEYDLLLVDFTLKNSDSGDKIIEFIRNINDAPILTDVLFYSSAIENVRDSMKNLGLEGIYTADRKDIENKFELVVNTTIKKVQEVNTMRGLILATESDLAEKMFDIIENIIKNNKIIGALIHDYAFKVCEESVGSKQNDFNNYKKDNDVFALINDTLIFDSNKKSRVIQKIIKEFNKNNNDELAHLSNFSKEYTDEILHPRNTFGHVIPKIINNERVLIPKRGKEIIFTDQVCIDIRKKLVKYSEKIDIVQSKIK